MEATLSGRPVREAKEMERGMTDFCFAFLAQLCKYLRVSLLPLAVGQQCTGMIFQIIIEIGHPWTCLAPSLSKRNPHCQATLNFTPRVRLYSSVLTTPKAVASCSSFVRICIIDEVA